MKLNVHLAMFAACLFWGVSFIASKLALEHLTPLMVVFLRHLIAALAFALWLLAKRQKLCWQPRWLATLALLALINSVAHHGVQAMGLKLTQATNASLYSLTGPIFVYLISFFWLKERITAAKLAGLVIALSGVLVVLGIDELKNFKLVGSIAGDLLVILSIFSWALCTVISRQLLTRKASQQTNPLELSAGMTVFGVLWLLPLANVGGSLLHWTHVPPLAWMSVIFLGLTCSFLATLLSTWAVGQTESQKVAIYLYTIPPITYLIAALFLHEPITARLLMGSLLVVSGVVLTERG